MSHSLYRRSLLVVLILSLLLLTAAIALQAAPAELGARLSATPRDRSAPSEAISSRQNANAPMLTGLRPSPMSYEGSHRAALHAIPLDDASIFVAAGRLGGVSTPLQADLRIGPTSYEPSHSDYDPATDEYGYTFEGVASPYTSPAMTIAITTTEGTTGTRTLGTSDFVRQYVAGDISEEFASPDTNLRLFVPTGALGTDAYLIIMNTFAPPGDPPPGHRLISPAYSIRASGAMTQSQTPLLLQINYEPEALGEADPHTLSMFLWNEDDDPARQRWQDVESEPFGDEPVHARSIRRLGTYALMTGTTWRDAFVDYSGLAEDENVRLEYGGRLALRSGSTQGWAVSMPISPTGGFVGWGRLRYAAELPAGTALTVDMLAEDGTLLLANVPDGASLADIDPVAHPILRLRATLNTAQAGVTPYLDSWAVQWTPATTLSLRFYLPMIIAPLTSQFRGAPQSAMPPSDPGGTLYPPALEGRGGQGNSFGCDPPAAPPITWSSPVVLTPGNDISIASDVAADGEGRLHAVWYRGNGPILYASKESGTTAWSAPVSISGSGSAYYPRVVVDHQDNVHAVWTASSDVFYATRPKGGNWSVPVNVSHSGAVGIRPILYADTVGNLHLVWPDNSLGNNEILYAYKERGAGSWSAPQRVSDTAGSSWAPDVVADNQGSLHVVWYDFTPGVTEIYYAYKAPGASLWSAAINVSRTAGGSQWPALAVDPHDIVHLIWQDTLPLAGQGQAIILYYAARPAGGGWSVPLEIGRSQTGPQQTYPKAQPPALAVDPTGVVHAAWASMTDYRLYYALRPDAEAGWSLPQVVAPLIPPPNPANQWYFIGLAADADRGVHLVWNDMEGTGTFNQDIKYSAALPPPIPADHVLVLDADGRAVSGACVYRNGQLAGTTNDLGIFVPDTLSPGDRLVALKPLAEQPAPGRDSWAYRTALTSLALSPDGAVSGHTVTTAGRQRLTLHTDTPLVYYNLIVAIQWNATPEYMQEISAAVRLASDYLFDVSDGQMAFGHVAIYDDGEHWEDADIQVLTRNNVRPYSYVGGLVSADPAQTIRVGRQWDGRSGAQGPWDARNGFRTLVHEFGHYALHLYDSYFEYLYDENNNLIGINKNTGCTELDFVPRPTPTPRPGQTPTPAPSPTPGPSPDAIQATIMDYQYATSELAARDVPGLWEPLCEHTVQWQLNEESDWKTLLRHYADSANPPRWRFSTPFTRGGVLAGPDGLPQNLLAFPEVEIHERGLAAPLRQLTVLDTDGQPYRQNALVALETQRSGRTVTLDQGLTSRDGQITIYGASTGNTLRAVSISGALWAQTTVGAAAVYTLTLHSSGGLQTANAPANPYASLIPDSEGRDLTLAVGGVGPGGALSALVVSPGSDPSQTIELSYSPESGAYEGTASFATAGTGLGSVHVRGVAAFGQHATVDGDFHLAQADVAAEQDLYTPDGAAWLHLDPASFAAANVYVALLPTGAVPQPLPTGLIALGNAYSIRASGGITDTARPGVLRLLYEPADLPGGVAPADLRIARWDDHAGAWQLLPGEPDPERYAVVAQADRFGIYALLAPARVEGQETYLPLLLSGTWAAVAQP